MAETPGSAALQIKAVDRHGTGATKVQMSDGTGASQPAVFDANGVLTAGTAPYDICLYFPADPNTGTITASEKLGWTCPNNRAVAFQSNFTDARGRCLTTPTATATFTLYKIPNGSTTPTQIGTVTISTGGAFTFASTSGTAYSFAVGDTLKAVAPSTSDATLADVSFTLPGTR